ncbi:unnamed protein product [Gordionus sp. m RMFG-2023]
MNDENADLKPLIETSIPENKNPDKLARKKLSALHAAQYCITFIILDVAKQVVTYSIKYYNNGLYPLPQTQIVAWIEAIKLLCCAIALFYSYHHNHNKSKFKLSPLFAIPALIYSLNNNLYLIALNYTTPPIWLMLIQSRVFLTALVYRFWFGKRLTRLQWFSLGLLVSSLYCLTLMNTTPQSSAIVDIKSHTSSNLNKGGLGNDEDNGGTQVGSEVLHIPDSEQDIKPRSKREADSLQEKKYVSPMPPSPPSSVPGNVTAKKVESKLGGLSLVAILLSLLSASLSVTASIITEYFFKNDKRPFMEQQVQMYIFSFALSSIFCFFEPNTSFSRILTLQISPDHLIPIPGIFTLLIATLLLGALGGLAVAAIVKNLDNIVKIYCSSLGNMGTALFSWALFPDRFTLDAYYSASLALLFAAIYLYESPAKK